MVDVDPSPRLKLLEVQLRLLWKSLLQSFILNVRWDTGHGT